MKYRKISPCIWNDAKVRELSDKGKLALLFDARLVLRVGGVAVVRDGEVVVVEL